jgi:single-strand DNA-binding protein
MINKVIMVGRLATNPEFDYVGTDKKPKSTFRIAVKGYGDKSDFFTVSSWNKQAEYVSNNLKSGDMIFVEGRLSVRETEKDGVKSTWVEIVSNEIQRLAKKFSKTEEAEAEPDSGSDELSALLEGI